ncbi:myeloid leukemia factor isoform X2 [Phymastichus coffea]|uniref:myeloid leukemia factor isoform X2 n=1 Tax=Phymastichus coffea TaxID=108790 RepID=UPI00273ABC69|nr:myeloid leukemia factor isoform X2 [Phymastichus coffea]
MSERFALGMFGDFDEDPYVGARMRYMNEMMSVMNNSLFADPLGLFGSPALMNNDPQTRMNSTPGLQLMPIGFPMMPSLPMGRMFAGLENMSQNPNCHSFTSSSIMTMTSSGPDGRPQVYQETMSTRSAPGGVKETKKTVSDSRTGTRSMAIGHHIGDRAHILEREQNMRSGEQEERQEFINLEEEEAEAFNREWQSRTKRSAGAIAGSSHRARNPYNRSQQENKPLALPSTVQRSAENSCSNSTSTDSNAISSASTPVISVQPGDSGSTATWCTSTSPATARSNSGRKRERSPGPSSPPSSKRHSSQSRSSSSDKDPIPYIDVTD